MKSITYYINKYLIHQEHLRFSILKSIKDYFTGSESAKAAAKAGDEKAARLTWNAEEVERAQDINDKAYIYNINSQKITSEFNDKSRKKQIAFQNWATKHNDTITLRSGMRQRGSQRVAMSSSGVASGGSMTDVMRYSEIEYNLNRQAELYRGLYEVDRLFDIASIKKYEEDNKAWNLNFARSEAKRNSALEAKDLRWQAKIAHMGGQAGAQAAKTQGFANTLNTVMRAAEMFA
tara:strand:+ start:1809 stop:2510 length:702 start_codon:yes stop_codon:yes gene_type:complete